ncbi:MAG: decarboxylating 6-phosphogluconate dehydrogenase [Candidatus Dormibacteraeota bacterium]|uniref:Decarboxylating 6-phosphogluconate dehydrogenase n=1 Tax=Candidatus Aeolococcus gillhamiae TaxID=3127015 RepID=A0A2W5ZCB6_9BACT|nr:decarboxylating 6-phosphogluconate dehydrogenase [Candidatus Dormibacteraeota bacterium]PZR83069.1 MAG: decarboxylating 6-phosphogluconate dehydrogenase [Candidatus Dormibacter sp. RRmetagenome_bin12]
MQIGFVGLGRMGANMVHRLRRDGDHAVVAFDRDPEARVAAEALGATAVASLTDLAPQLAAPRAVWIMVPAGEITEQVIDTLLDTLERGDAIVDGGNSNWHDTVARAQRCADRGITFIDAGTSGGIWGLSVGYCLMVGGDTDAVERLRPIFETLAPKDGFLHVGPAGSGHYVKMVHNGIEYGMLQAYAEGFNILHASKDFPGLDLHAIAHLWNQGSVVRSWLLELAESAFEKDPQLDSLRGWVDDSGEGRWTIDEAMNLSVPAPVLVLSLMARYQSRQPDGFGNKVIAALRNEFGGHAVKTEDKGNGPPASTAMTQ